MERGASLELQQPSYEYEHNICMLKIAKQKEKQPWTVSVMVIYAMYSTLQLILAQKPFLNVSIFFVSKEAGNEQQFHFLELSKF